MAKGSDGPSTEYLLFEEPQKDGKIRVGVVLDKQKDEGIYGYTWMRFEVNHTFDDGRIVIFDDLYSAIPGTDYMPQVEFHFTSDGIANTRPRRTGSTLFMVLFSYTRALRAVS